MLLEMFWAYWYWLWLLIVFMYYATVLERSVGIKYLISTPVRYTPPEGLGVLLSGMIYDKFTEHRDFIASILELKLLGFIKIEKQENGDFLIIRTDKSSKGMILSVQYLIDEVLFVANTKSYLLPKKLFVRNHTKWQATQRRQEIIEDYHQLNVRTAQMATSERYMKENPKKARSRFVGWSILLVMVMIVLAVFSGQVHATSAFVSFFFVYFPLFFVVYHKSIFAKIFTSLFPLMIIVPMFINDELRVMLFEGSLSLGLYFVVLLVQGAFMFTYEYVGALSIKGKMIRNHLNGYKVFLKRVKKDEVQRRQKEDPDYIDKALPYMILFGIEEYDLNLKSLEDRPR